ncbi:MAG: hypothetical protein HY891_09000 [Deltaproteobacteria bacterium]|nr:hypothetical protein [Deltaproteobacteria bacterium]
MKRPSCLISALITAVVLLFVAQGCAHKPDVKLFMYPDDKGSEGYSRKADQGVFENKSIRVTVRKIGDSDDEGLSQEVIAHLLKKDYLIFRMEIENTSRHRAIYNPSFTTFTDDAMDYGTPIDYTDLYDMAEGVWEKEAKDGEKKPFSMNGLKGLFYDLATTIPPGGKTSKLLIFKPISTDCTKAALTLSELYIGTETIRVIFPFVFKPKEG